MATTLTIAKQSPKWTDDKTLAPVRAKVRQLLEASPSFKRLSPEERQQFAKQMVDISAYLANPEGVITEEMERQKVQRETPKKAPLSSAQADAVDIAGKRAASSPGFAGKDFQAGGVKQGVQQFGELVKKVDFPKFVSGLIQNVFQAIVDSSIQQMRAYGDLLANVAKTVDQFAQDNISENNARDFLAQKYPGKLGIDTSQTGTGFAAGDSPAVETPKLVTKGQDPEADLTAISTDLGLDKAITDISDPEQEQALVLKARLQMARQRQQLLSSMVVLGINRIVVTDGLIHAKVVFDLQASDVAQRGSRASLYDSQENKSSTDMSVSYGSWLSPISASGETTTSSDHVTTVQSSLDETSESKAQVKANLTGEVRVNFKSDYFPMEKLASPEMISAIQGNAVPKDKPAAAVTPAKT
jgi:hypothetical protein